MPDDEASPFHFILPPKGKKHEAVRFRFMARSAASCFCALDTFFGDSSVYFFGIFTNHTCISNDSGINYAEGSAFRISGKQ